MNCRRGGIIAEYAFLVSTQMKNWLNVMLLDYQAWLPSILIAIAVLLVVIGLLKLPKV